jgi:hypothetical protein
MVLKSLTSTEANKLFPSTPESPNLGGWKVLRQRTDKSANASVVAKSILEAILVPDLEEPLKATLSDISKDEFTRPVIGQKRQR